MSFAVFLCNLLDQRTAIVLLIFAFIRRFSDEICYSAKMCVNGQPFHHTYKPGHTEKFRLYRQAHRIAKAIRKVCIKCRCCFRLHFYQSGNEFNQHYQSTVRLTSIVWTMKYLYLNEQKVTFQIGIKFTNALFTFSVKRVVIVKSILVTGEKKFREQIYGSNNKLISGGVISIA